MIVVYISGPISNGGKATVHERYANADRSHQYHRLFVESGLGVVNPILTQHVDPGGDISHDQWLRTDFAIIERCDCVYRMTGESSGADAECNHAERKGIPVFHWAADVVAFGAERDRESVLDVAGRVAGASRSRDYGHPLENHERIARLWNGYIRNNPSDELTAEDVAMMMILLKVARQQNAHKADNLVDMAGYARCLELIEQRRAVMAARLRLLDAREGS